MDCVVDGCGAAAAKRGLCNKHYLSLRRSGRLEDFATKPARGKYAPPEVLACTGVEQCGRPNEARGLCNACYQRKMRAGEIQPLPKVNSGKSCKVDGCGKPAAALGYCIAHYEKVKKYGDPMATATKKTGMPCSVDQCDGVVVAKGLCAKHYYRAARHGSPDKFSARHLARFEERLDDKGYVLVPARGEMATRGNGRRAAKHRLVMSEFLGRPLRDNENVHHINGNRADNRIENLELWVSSQPSGQRPLDLLKWAEEIIKLYGKEKSKLRRLKYRADTASLI